MRRKCFALLIILIALLALADAVGIPLKSGQISLEEGKAILCTGKVMRVKESENKADLQIRLKTCDGHEVNFSEEVLVSFYGEASAKEILRRTIKFKAEFKGADVAGNPHCFDYRKYLKSRGIGKVAVIKSYSLEAAEQALLDKYERNIYRIRNEFLESVSPNARGMISGVLFGDTSLMEEEAYEEFRENGTAHILAVSGLHVGILYGIYKKLAGRRRSLPALVSLVCILFVYGSLAMWSTSSCRAILMILISTAGRYSDRRNDMLTSMSVAAFILIADNPYVIFAASFQMSFLAIMSIAFLKPVMPGIIPDGLATAMSVNAGLLIYQVYNFNYISFVSIIANIPIIYMTGYFVPAALLGFCAFVSGFGWELFRPVTEGFALMLEKTNHLMNFNGFSGMDVPSPPIFVILFLMAGGFFLSSETFYILHNRKKYKKIACVFLTIFIASAVCEAFAYSPVTHDDVVFVDVGQGDCVHVKAEGKNVLIDGGGAAEYNVGKNKLKPYLLKNGIGKVDAAIATHRHTDHYKGLTELAECMRMGQIYTEMTKGRTMRISDEVWIESLWPISLAEGQTQDENKDCSVFMVHYGKYRVLITGDLDMEGEAALIKHYAGTEVLKADILKVGHHGSKTSTSEDFLKTVAPKAAVIQVGRNNYGHPTEETLSRLRDFGCIVLRNDENGAVGVSFGKNKMKIHTMYTF